MKKESNFVPEGTGGTARGPVMTRRGFGLAMAASAMLPRAAFAEGQGAEHGKLIATAFNRRLLPPEYPETPVWGYNGQTPGTELRLTQGARLRQTLRNDLDQPTTIHWHGLRIDNAMDGVPGMTQPAVQPGQEFVYDFTVPDAGTYWYHAHNRSTEQIARGLLGALIVEEPNAPDIDREEVLVIDDWLVGRDGALVADFEAPHARAHGGRIGNLITTNGDFDLTMKARRNERMRLRLINASNARVFDFALQGLEGWVMALDGMPLADTPAVGEALTLGPGQRADLFVDVTAEVGEQAYLVRLDRDQASSQVMFEVGGVASAKRREAPAALPPNRKPALEGLKDLKARPLVLEGGAMGGLQNAILDGNRRSFEELIKANQFWSFNGIVGQTDTPFLDVKMGETQLVEIRNDTSFPHAMHLHGMHFQELDKDGTPGRLRDTTLLFPREVRQIAFVADNPGDWLFHCHMLSHAASGMTSWIRVQA